MTGTGLPQPLAEAIQAVRAATAEILAAASGDDPETLRAAVEQRGLAIQRLTPIVRDAQDTLGAEQRRALDAEAEELFRQGKSAEVALASILETARGAMDSFGKGAAAIRRYAAPAEEPGGLDHSA
jgi:hypothetical protein